MKIRTIVIDDEIAFIKTFQNILKSKSNVIELLGHARSVEEGVRIIDTMKPDLVFLDINLDEGTGFDILRMVKYHDFKLIFVTAHDQHAIEAFKFSAIDYLLKPVISNELWNAVNRVKSEMEKEILHFNMNVLMDNMSEMTNERKRIVLKERDMVHIVRLEEILFCSAEGSYTIFYLLNDKKIMVSQHLKEYQEILENNGFFRAHRSYLVNLDKIEKYEKSSGGIIYLRGGKSLPVAVRKKEKLFDILSKLLL